VLNDYKELAYKLPDVFYDTFTDPNERDYARLIELWAGLRGLAFASKNPPGVLPTWFAVVEMTEGLEPILTMQSSRRIVNNAGREQAQGVSDVPFHRQSSPFLSAPGNKEAFLSLLHTALPQDKPLDVGDLSGYWPFTWNALSKALTTGTFIVALDWAVNGVVSA